MATLWNKALNSFIYNSKAVGKTLYESFQVVVEYFPLIPIYPLICNFNLFLGFWGAKGQGGCSC